MQEKKSPIGICISQNPFAYENGVLFVPFYQIDQIPALVKQYTQAD